MNSAQPRIGIFVIAYNAESHIQKTLERIAPEIWDRIEVAYVLDDCSTDETVAKALDVAGRYPKLEVLRNRVNRRYGGNQKFGYQYAIDRGLDIVVMLHADGQYAPEELSRMVQPLVENQADIVIGSRMIKQGDALKGGMPRYKYFGNIILTRVENLFSGMNLSEFHSGYRAYSTAFLKSIPLWENTDEWHFDTQILLQAHALRARIVELPIPTYYGDEICHVNGLAYAANCIKEASIYWLHRRGLIYGRRYDVNKVSSSHYGDKYNDPFSSHTLIWNWLNVTPLKGRRILELGVGDASLTRRLHAAGAVVDGVEISPQAAEAAKPYGRNIVVGDLNRIEALGLENEYDAVVVADVLEHLADPEQVLSVLKRLLKRGGDLYVSLPNFTNIYVRLNILLGRIPLHSKGLLDRTHLHIYTLKSMQHMLKKTGWIVVQKDLTCIPLLLVFPFMERFPFRVGLYALRGLTKLMPGLFAYQGLFVCRNPNQASLL